MKAIITFFMWINVILGPFAIVIQSIDIYNGQTYNIFWLCCSSLGFIVGAIYLGNRIVNFLNKHKQ
jgi:hypothetical protein